MSRFLPGIFKPIGKFLFGSPEKRENVSTLRPEQEGLYNQLLDSMQGPGGGGAFGSAADYYHDLMDNSQRAQQGFAEPTMREYQEDIMPGLSNQFGGLGGGFEGAQYQGSSDLMRRLSSMRAGLRSNAAQGLYNLGQLGLSNYSQNMVTQPGSQGFLGGVAPAIGHAFGSYMSGIGGAPGAAGPANPANPLQGAMGAEIPVR